LLFVGLGSSLRYFAVRLLPVIPAKAGTRAVALSESDVTARTGNAGLGPGLRRDDGEEGLRVLGALSFAIPATGAPP